MDNPRLRKSLLIVAVFAGLGLLVMVKTYLEDTARQGYLVREGYGGQAYESYLTVENDTGTEEVLVRVEPRRYTAEEMEHFLNEAETGLEALVMAANSPDVVANTPDATAAAQQENTRHTASDDTAAYENRAADDGAISLTHVDRDLTLPTRFPDKPVKITWLSRNPQAMDYEGHLTDRIPEDGQDVVLEASLVCQDESREATLEIRVYPKKVPEEEALQKAVNDWVDSADPTVDKLTLPEAIGGQKVRWSSGADKGGTALILMGIAVAILLAYRVKQKEDEAARQRRKAMERDYPAIVSKLVLLMSAGLSMRGAFYKMAQDYEVEKQQRRSERPGYELIVTMCREMDRGLPECEAYRLLGGRDAPVIYRTFSVLLIQNLRMGTRDLMDILEREAVNAFEARKSAAKVKGEEASSKLLIPMVMMLGIVFVMVMVPAFISMNG
ncbi:MAG: hypothetical protein Q4B73_07890 [Lachnospiraceae bacterium]|nr:hypothetical protein [Lachnospiraceae bacterium]